MVTHSPKREGWVFEVLDESQVFAELEWQKHAQYTPAERIRFGEELRRLAYGDDAIDARMDRVFFIRQSIF
jgi:hypothetical protein